jgi:hypothetical protein
MMFCGSSSSANGKALVRRFNAFCSLKSEIFVANIIYLLLSNNI